MTSSTLDLKIILPCTVDGKYKVSYVFCESKEILAVAYLETIWMRTADVEINVSFVFTCSNRNWNLRSLTNFCTAVCFCCCFPLVKKYKGWTIWIKNRVVSNFYVQLSLNYVYGRSFRHILVQTDFFKMHVLVLFCVQINWNKHKLTFLKPDIPCLAYDALKLTDLLVKLIMHIVQINWNIKLSF